jgi:membrane dipeptidase
MTSTEEILGGGVVWDNHACMPLRANADEFLPQLERLRQAGVHVVSLNVHFGETPLGEAFVVLAAFRSFIQRHPDRYRLIERVADIEATRAAGQLGVFFDLEGGVPVEAHPGMVEVFYRLGVRWMLIAYNRNNKLACWQGGGRQSALAPREHRAAGPNPMMNAALT